MNSKTKQLQKEIDSLKDQINVLDSDINKTNGTIYGSRNDLAKHNVISSEIDTEWLLMKHPELYAKDAVALREFCFNHPAKIRLKACYGNGENMFPKWKESLKQN